MYCTKCGSENEESSKFCTKCGQALSKTSVIETVKPASNIKTKLILISVLLVGLLGVVGGAMYFQKSAVPVQEMAKAPVPFIPEQEQTKVPVSSVPVQEQAKVPVSSIPVIPRLTSTGLTYFSPIEKMSCDFPGGNAQCEGFIKEILPNGYQDCNTSMASGGWITWGGKYKTASGMQITLLLRSGRGQYLQFIPTNSNECEMKNYLAVNTYGTGEVSEPHKGEGEFLSLLVKGDTIYYALINSTSWDNEKNQYKYSRTVYKVSGEGSQEFVKQEISSTQLKEIDEALPLRADLTQYN